MRTPSIVVGAIALLVSSCGGSDKAASPGDSTASVAAGQHPLVGEWERETTCAELVQALQEAGMGNLAAEAAAGNGFVPGVESVGQLGDPKRPCEGAVPRKHSHFFTAGGLFGSRDWNGNQVDEGMYEIVDGDTLVIPYGFEQSEPIQVSFSYRIDGDTVRFEPVIPSNCSDARCREAAAWSVSVAYAGKEWIRAP